MITCRRMSLGTLLGGALVLSLQSSGVEAQTEFSYQGRLLAAGNPAEGAFDFELSIYDTPSAGDRLAGPFVFLDQPVDRGRLRLTVDLEALPLTDGEQWIEITVRGPEDSTPHTLLPRQRLFAVPVAGRAMIAGTDSVDANAIFDRSVTSARISPGSVGPTQLADASINTGQLAAGAVTSGSIARSAITDAQIADAAVTGEKISRGAVNAAALAENSIDARVVAPRAVTEPKLADDSIDRTHIASGAVTGDRLASSAVVTSRFRNGSVGAAEINSSEVQRRISGTCSGGFIREINENGGVTCELDNVGILGFGTPVQFFVTSSNGQGAVNQVIGELDNQFCMLSLIELTDVDGSNELGTCQLGNAGIWVLQAETTGDATATCGAVCLPYQ